jgi:hypothetical protein
MLHDQRGKRKAETGAGIKVTVRQNNWPATVTRSLSIADLSEQYQSAFFLINVGTSRSSTRFELPCDAGNSSGDRGA